MKKKLKKFFSSYIPIIIFAFLTSILALIYAGIIRSSTRIYSFHTYNEYFSVKSGLIALTNQSTTFEGNNITYVNDEEIKVVEYKLGYYFKDGNNYDPILETSGTLNEATSLKVIIDSIVGFDFVEPARMDGTRLLYKNRKLINNNLYFVITYKTSTDSEQEILESKLLVSEVD